MQLRALAGDDDWVGWDMPTYADFSDPSTSNGTGSTGGFSLPSMPSMNITNPFGSSTPTASPPPTIGASASAGSGSWLTDLFKNIVPAVTAIKAAEIKSDAQSQQLQYQLAQQQLQRNNLMYPYGTTGLGLPTLGQPGYSPFPGLPSVGGGISMTTIIGIAGLGLALMTLMKKD